MFVLLVYIDLIHINRTAYMCIVLGMWFCCLCQYGAFRKLRVVSSDCFSWMCGTSCLYALI